MNSIKVIILVVLSGITTGVGAFFGSLFGSISQSIIAICLSFAAGAMLYVVTGELTPEANKLYTRKNVCNRKYNGIYNRNNSCKYIICRKKL